MKIAGLLIGIVLTILSTLALVICFMLPALTSNHVNKKEAMLGIIPSAIFILIGLLIASVFGILLAVGKKKEETGETKEAE